MGKWYWAGQNVTENHVKQIDIFTIKYSFIVTYTIQLTYK